METTIMDTLSFFLQQGVINFKQYIKLLEEFEDSLFLSEVDEETLISYSDAMNKICTNLRREN